MMRKQNKGSDFLPMQTRTNSELSIILMSLIFHCELARINFFPPRSSTGKWVVLRRELGGNAVDEKSVAVGIGVGYQEDPRWAKKSTPPVRGDFEKPPELYCSRGDEREEQGRMKKMNRSEETEEINYSPSTFTCYKDNRPYPTLSQYQLDAL